MSNNIYIYAHNKEECTLHNLHINSICLAGEIHLNRITMICDI